MDTWLSRGRVKFSNLYNEATNFGNFRGDKSLNLILSNATILDFCEYFSLRGKI